jgi:pimeloyl-ACP methyl ester carboxylesterase
MSRPDLPLDHVTPYDRFALSDVDIERLLVSGDHEKDLIAYFGAEEYQELARLARQGAATPVKDEGLRVILVPGIMGSQLGLLRKPPLPNDVLWVDPIDIELGRLATLRVPGNGDAARAEIVSLGVVTYSYLKLKLHLRAAGFAAAFHDYDWRLSVDELGRSLAERLRNEPAERLAIVAHSMGGLVSRAAVVLPGAERVERVILLGTPNYGSFAPIQALRGTYAVVRKLARLDREATAESLSGEVFNTFPSLYQMLPAATCSDGTDLFDAAAWPTSGPRPDPTLLEHARTVQAGLAQPDHRFACIVGIGQETVTSVRRHKDDFVYTITRHGDGTVPAISAALPGAQALYAPVAHSDLTRDPMVAAAVIELLSEGVTQKLPRKWTTASRAEAQITDRELRRTHTQKVDWAALEPEERRLFLQDLNEPPELKLRVPGKAKPSAKRTTRAKLEARAKPSARIAAASKKTAPKKSKATSRAAPKAHVTKKKRGITRSRRR